MEFELAYYDYAAHRFNHYTTNTFASSLWFQNKVQEKINEIEVVFFFVMTIYKKKNWYIKLEITTARKSGTHRHLKHWTAVSTLLSFISIAHRHFHHWGSKQQPQYAQAETLPPGNWFTPRTTDTESTTHGKLRDHMT